MAASPHFPAPCRLLNLVIVRDENQLTHFCGIIIQSCREMLWRHGFARRAGLALVHASGRATFRTVAVQVTT